MMTSARSATSSVAHLEESGAARGVALSEDDMAALEASSIPDSR